PPDACATRRNPASAAGREPVGRLEMRTMTNRIPVCATALAVFAGALLAGGARADTAVVVGVNQYGMLQHADLKGCVNDARAIAEGLRKYGFKVVVLADDQATRQGILGVISQLKSTGNERVVFYFAGHGT